jgi:hypothetical protein
VSSLEEGFQQQKTNSRRIGSLTHPQQSISLLSKFYRESYGM